MALVRFSSLIKMGSKREHIVCIFFILKRDVKLFRHRLEFSYVLEAMLFYVVTKPDDITRVFTVCIYNEFDSLGPVSFSFF